MLLLLLLLLLFAFALASAFASAFCFCFLLLLLLLLFASAFAFCFCFCFLFLLSLSAFLLLLLLLLLPLLLLLLRFFLLLLHLLSLLLLLPHLLLLLLFQLQICSLKHCKRCLCLLRCLQSRACAAASGQLPQLRCLRWPGSTEPVLLQVACSQSSAACSGQGLKSVSWYAGRSKDPVRCKWPASNLCCCKWPASKAALLALARVSRAGVAASGQLPMPHWLQ